MTSTAPKGLSWPEFVSWYSKKGSDKKKRSAAWEEYKKKYHIKSKVSSQKKVSTLKRTKKQSSRPVDQDEWDEMGRTLNLISSGLKSAKKQNRRTKASVQKKYKSTPDSPSKPWYKSSSKLTHRQRKYCDCLLEITNANNPYAVCAASTHGSVHRCGDEYDWKKLPREQLYNYAVHARKPPIRVSEKDSKEVLLKKIQNWKKKKYG